MNLLYEVLEVQPDCTAAQIKAAFKRLSNRLHPDKPTGDVEKFKELNHAYSVLSNKAKRKEYDQSGKTQFEIHLNTEPYAILSNAFATALATNSFLPMDYIGDVKKSLYIERENCKKEIAKMNKSIVDIEYLIANFKGDIVNSFLNFHLENIKAAVVINEKLVVDNLKAIELIDELGIEYNGKNGTVSPWEKSGGNALPSYNVDDFDPSGIDDK